MPKKTEVTGYHIVVEPDTRYTWQDNKVKAAKEICEGIKTQIKRHCDGFGSVQVNAEIEISCEHCGHTWTEVSSTYNGGCCDKDEANNPDSKGGNS